MSFDRPPVGQRPVKVDRRVDVPGSRLKVDPAKTRAARKRHRDNALQRQRDDAKPRRQLERSRKQAPSKMSSEAQIQDAMLGKGRCYPGDGMATDCTDGHSQRAHIVKQTIIADAFEHGAWRYIGEATWRAVALPFTFDLSEIDFIPLQEILDDNRNLVPTCPNHNVDGAAMVKALDVVGYPEGFEDFQREFAFQFGGRYWSRVAG